MNDEMHPHWHSTEDDEMASPVPQSIRVRRDGAFNMPTVSRLPAAIVGILVVLLIGALTIGDVLPQRAALPPGEPLPVVNIHINENGFVPTSVTVSPGQTILWTNEQDDFPHILQSESLLDGSGNYLYSPPIFPDAPYSFTLANNQEAGSFKYISMLSTELEGTVIVQVNTSSSTSPASSSPPQASSSAPSSAPASAASSAASSTAPATSSSAQSSSSAANSSAGTGGAVSSSPPAASSSQSVKASSSKKSASKSSTNKTSVSSKRSSQSSSQTPAAAAAIESEPPVTQEPFVAICGNGTREIGEECESNDECVGGERARCEACSCILVQQQKQQPFGGNATNWGMQNIPSNAAPSTTGIPINPYALGSGAANSSLPLAGEKKGASHTAAPVTPQPRSQPQTGPTLWAVIFGSMTIIVWMTRRTPRAIKSN